MTFFFLFQKRPLLIITEGVEMEVAGSLVLSPACCQSEVIIFPPFWQN